jgi:hypothetical protein
MLLLLFIKVELYPFAYTTSSSFSLAVMCGGGGRDGLP